MLGSEGTVHIAGQVRPGGTQLCKKCGAELAVPPIMAQGISIEEAQAMEPETFPEDALVAVVTEDSGSGTVTTLPPEKITWEQMTLGSYRWCDESPWETEIARQDAE
jgi:hypothetical protein